MQKIILTFIFLLSTIPMQLNAKLSSSKSIILSDKAEIYNRIKIQDDRFVNEHCIAYHLRHNKWNDIKIALGFFIEQMILTPISDFETGEEYTGVKLRYFDVNSNEGEPTIYRCLHKTRTL